jgi:hypothetical protein
VSEYFATSRAVYWPSEFSDIALMLQGKNINEESTHPPIYTNYVHAVVLAAVIGLLNNREREVGQSRKEISTETFENQKYGIVSLAAFLYLVPLIAKKDINLLRSEREEDVVRSFEKFAAGGFEYLRGALNESHDIEGEAVLEAEVRKVLKTIEASNPEGSEMINIFSKK